MYTHQPIAYRQIVDFPNSDSQCLNFTPGYFGMMFHFIKFKQKYLDFTPVLINQLRTYRFRDRFFHPVVYKGKWRNQNVSYSLTCNSAMLKVESLDSCCPGFPLDKEGRGKGMEGEVGK